ncbi:MAG TPA: Rieske 2Fe-2S domain-containing protein [Gemmatimonadales bacterium]|nr:Rieske 2Fe-2S domain-containing protein [Gemmatimonadales bacterium]
MTHSPSCSGCGDPDRRAFLREATGFATSLLLSLGIAPQVATALPIRAGTGRRMPGHPDVSYPIPAEDCATIDKQNQVILVRYRGSAYAFALSCPHQNTALRWSAEDRVFQCPKHKSRYQPDGTFITGRATRNMDRLPIKSDGKQLFVDVARVFESDKDPAGWAAAVVKL